MDQKVIRAALVVGLFGALTGHSAAQAPASRIGIEAVELPPPVAGRDFGEEPKSLNDFVTGETIDIPPVTASELAPVQQVPPPAASGPVPALQTASPAAGSDIAPIAGALASLLSVSSPAAMPTPAAQAEMRALAAFYAERSYAPVWVDASGLNARAVAAIARMKAAAQDGLNPDAFVTPDPKLASGLSRSPEDLARTELAVSHAALLYAKQAQSGRVVPRSLSPLITAEPPVPDPVAALRTIAGAQDVAAALESFNPPQPGFRALRAKLADLLARGRVVETIPTIPDGPVLRPGKSDPRVALLRERLKLPPSASDVYEPDLVQAVQTFQRGSGLNAAGVVGELTVRALNGARRGDPTSDIIANMERWRWLPRDLGAEYVMVNIPDYALKIVRNGIESYRTRVIVGKATNQTPIFSNAIQFIIVNPYWHVPTSIAVKEMLPNLRNDPGYLARQGIEVVKLDGKRGQVVDPYSIDWSSVNMNRLQFRQLPGERNALGRIKFMFPNVHSVYLHDTPSRSLFGRDMRALSHGCVRVDQPLQFGEALLTQEGMTAKKLGGLVGGPERRVGIKRSIPVHLTYFTEYVDDAGILHSRPDIYGHDKQLKRVLGLEGVATAAQ